MKIAIVTQVYNESFFLPIWLNHYGPLFGYENLFIIDDGSTDNSTSDHRIRTLIRKKHTVLDEDDRALLVSLFHEELLRFYNIVIYVDCDELIVVDPKCGLSLVNYLRQIDRDQTNVIGFNVLHRVAFEGGLDVNMALFEQRKFVHFSPEYCKPLISRTPIRWLARFHASNKVPAYDVNLFLFHLRAVDFENSKRRIKTLNTIQLSTNALHKGQGTHFQLRETDYLKQLLFLDDDLFRDAISAEPIDIFRNYISTRRDGGLNPRALDFFVWDSKPIVIPDIFKNVIILKENSDGRFSHDATVASAYIDSRVDPEEIQTIFDGCIEKMIKQGRGRPRNELCPCGSGKRYKHCHGSVR